VEAEQIFRGSIQMSQKSVEELYKLLIPKKWIKEQEQNWLEELTGEPHQPFGIRLIIYLVFTFGVFVVSMFILGVFQVLSLILS